MRRTSPTGGRTRRQKRSRPRRSSPERRSSSEALPEGYDTLLAEGGQNLSGGQRQRLAIARALLTEAPFLILDEPTSALDPHHERRLVETLHRLKRLRTIILVTHRLESVIDCDQIFVMEAGRIAERGTHAQLLGLGGGYARIVA